jgi:hypothetical protein
MSEGGDYASNFADGLFFLSRMFPSSNFEKEIG